MDIKSNTMRAGLPVKLMIIALMLIAGLAVSAADAEPAHAAAAQTAKPFSGKTVLVVGDSIQARHGKFLIKASKQLGAKKVVNKSEGGAFFGKRLLTSNCVYSKVMKMSRSQVRKYDYIILSAGTNDFGHHTNNGKVKLGKVTSKKKNTVCGAMNLMIRRIQTYSPNTKIIVVTPLYRYNWGKKKDCDKIKNKWGFTLKDYRTRMAQTASAYEGVYVVSGASLASKKEMRSHKSTPAYLHPTDKFARTLAKRCAKQLRLILK